MNSLAYLSRQFDVVASTVATTTSPESPPSTNVDYPTPTSGSAPQKRQRRWRSRRMRNSDHGPVATRRRSLLELSPFAWPILFAWGWSNRWPRSDKLKATLVVDVTDTENSEEEGGDEVRLDGLRLSADYTSNVPPTPVEDALSSSNYFNRPPTNITVSMLDPNPCVNLTPPTPNMDPRQLPLPLPRPEPLENSVSHSEQLLPNPLRLSLLTTPPPSRKSTPSASNPYPELRIPTPRPLPAPTPFHLPKTLILDLDETLIHSTSRSPHLLHTGSSGLLPFSLSVPFLGLGGSRNRGRAHMIEVVLGGRSTLYHVYKRPFVDYFLRKVASWYTLVIFTASMQEYADPVIDWLDAGRGILGKRLFRESCTQLPNGSYAKDLSIVEEDLSRVFLIDNSPVSYSFNPANGVPIEGWTSDASDEALLDLLPVLDSLRFTSDVRKVLGIRGFGLGSFTLGTAG